MIGSKGTSRTVAEIHMSNVGDWDHRGSSGRNKKKPGSAFILKVDPMDFETIGCRLGQRDISSLESKEATLKRKTILACATTWMNFMLK